MQMMLVYFGGHFDPSNVIAIFVQMVLIPMLVLRDFEEGF